MHSLLPMELAQEILLADWWHFQLCPCYLPGIANLEADTLSCQKAVIEWGALPKVACEVFCWLGWPQIDLFASQSNTLLLAFFLIHLITGPRDLLPFTNHATFSWHTHLLLCI